MEDNTSIKIKRIHEPAEPGDGARVLVDRLWPRGVSKEKAALTQWLREVAPSDELRRWFDHRPERWDEFRRKYSGELAAAPETWRPLRELTGKGPVTLLFAARDETRNNAVALKEFIEKQV